MQKISLETLSEDRLKRAVDAELWEEGRNLFEAGRAQVLDLKDIAAQCIVQDKHPYRVEIKIAKNNLYLKCDCRYAFRGLICAHDIAACFAIRAVLQTRLPPTWRNQIIKVIDAAQISNRRSTPTRYFLYFSLQEVGYSDYTTWKIIPIQLSYPAASKFVPEIKNGADHQAIGNWIEADPRLLQLLKTPYQTLPPQGCLNCGIEAVMCANIMFERSRTYHFYDTNQPIDDYLQLIASNRGALFLGDTQNPLRRAIDILEQPGELRLNIDREDRGLHLTARVNAGDKVYDIKVGENSNSQIIYPSPLWVLLDNHLINLPNEDLVDLFRSFVEMPDIWIPGQDANIFQSKYLLPLAEKLAIQGNLIEWIDIQTVPEKLVYLSESEAGIRAELRFVYNMSEVDFDPRYPHQTISRQADSWSLLRIRRDREAELVAFEDLTSSTYGLKRTLNGPKPGLLSLRARVHPVDFLLNHVPKLTAAGFKIIGEEQLKTARVNRNQPTISFQVATGIDWFDIKAIVNFGELEVSLKEIRKSLRKKDHYLKLPDGSIGAIPEEWLDRYKHLFGLGEETTVGIRLGRHHVSLIDQALLGASQVQTDQAYLDYRQRLTGFTGINPKDLPKDFNGELRPYQKAGYDWLHFLHEYGFGGCLADDMGLGKTVQTLIFLQGLKEAQNSGDNSTGLTGNLIDPVNCARASLIVVPRSLLANWQREAARFTPGLKLFEYFDANRQKDQIVFDEYDLVITTYGVMLRDIAFLCSYKFHYAILDESQVIKNPLSQTARAARLLQGCHRLVLTGTPVENTTLELWSQFEFINPGLLGHLEYFKNEFILPIEKKVDESSSQTLRKLVYPFILRRTKDQVAPELPPRTERILYCDMEPAQLKLYIRTRDYYRGFLLGMLEEEGLPNMRFRILEGLLRLRQISNHPRLLDEKFRGESGKFELLLETLETLRAEGHKALVFSQFVQMLRLLRQPLDELKVPYVYLDGHTRNRMELVDLYQNDPAIPFFLISLKAGGQGLNLTAADYVIHIDPWWNPAVEMQASDRTHRIGQEKPVFIFKLITRNSVEEKILQLQERKRKLVDQIVTSEGSFFKSLTPGDIHLLFS